MSSKEIEFIPLSYAWNGKIQVQILTIIRVQVAFLPLQTISFHIVQVVMQMARVEFICWDEMAPVETISHEEVDVILPHLGAECRVCIWWLNVRVSRFCFRVIDYVSADEVLELNTIIKNKIELQEPTQLF